jgi:hypothetical protein
MNELMDLNEMSNFEIVAELHTMLSKYPQYNQEETERLLLLVTFLKEEVEDALHGDD